IGQAVGHVGQAAAVVGRHHRARGEPPDGAGLRGDLGAAVGDVVVVLPAGGGAVVAARPVAGAHGRVGVVLPVVRVGRAEVGLHVGRHDRAPGLHGVGGYLALDDDDAGVAGGVGLCVQGVLFDVGQQHHGPVRPERLGEVEEVVPVLHALPP